MSFTMQIYNNNFISQAMFQKKTKDCFNVSLSLRSYTNELSEQAASASFSFTSAPNVPQNGTLATFKAEYAPDVLVFGTLSAFNALMPR